MLPPTLGEGRGGVASPLGSRPARYCPAPHEFVQLPIASSITTIYTMMCDANDPSRCFRRAASRCAGTAAALRTAGQTPVENEAAILWAARLIVRGRCYALRRLLVRHSS